LPQQQYQFMVLVVAAGFACQKQGGAGKQKGPAIVHWQGP
jgi:hypothetical protein